MVKARPINSRMMQDVIVREIDADGREGTPLAGTDTLPDK
jgi:hypothetical protein